MTQVEFKEKLQAAFKNHMLMAKREHHTVNELLWTLKYNNAFNGEDFNVSIRKLNGEWWCIPGLDFFVNIPCLSVWFNDVDVEFEIEECGEEKYNCITVYEREDV